MSNMEGPKGVQILILRTKIIENLNPNEENREIPNIDVFYNPNPAMFCYVSLCFVMFRYVPSPSFVWIIF